MSAHPSREIKITKNKFTEADKNKFMTISYRQARGGT